MGEREIREQQFYDALGTSGSTTRSILDRYSEAFYEKGRRGRIWSPFWESTCLKDASVLDYGCGDGHFSLMLARMGARVSGIDISPHLIAQARASAAKMGLNGGAPQFVAGDAHQTPFEAGTFDYVVGNGALHHLDLDKAFAEIARVLKPGGTAVFMEPMVSHPLLRLLRGLTPKTHTVDEHPLSFADIESAQKWFTSCTHREHFLLAVCAAPAHLLGKGFALSVINSFDQFDGFLMHMFPTLRRLAWLTVLELKR